MEPDDSNWKPKVLMLVVALLSSGRRIESLLLFLILFLFAAVTISIVESVRFVVAAGVRLFVGLYTAVQSLLKK